ncbi:MAG: diguanylate cyclase [Armatimonadota bacterium]
MTSEDTRNLERFFVCLRWLILLPLAAWLPSSGWPLLAIVPAYNAAAMLALRRPESFARWQRFVRLWTKVADAALITIGIFALPDSASHLALLYGVVVLGIGLGYGPLEALCASAAFSGIYWASLLTDPYAGWEDSMRLAVSGRVGFIALMAAVGGYSSLQWQKYRRLTNNTKRLAALNAFSEQIALAQDRGEILQFALDAAQRETSADGAAVLLLSSDASELVLSAQRGLPGKSSGYAIPIGEGVAGRVAATGEPANERLPTPDGVDPAPFSNTGSCLFVPLQGGCDLLGVLGVWRNGVEPSFTEDDAHLLQTMAGYCAIALSNVELIVRLKDAAVRDSLTGVYNHGYYLEFLESRVTEAVESGEPISVVLLDVDRFKRINDELGHPRGDAALIDVAQSLRGLARSTDLVARCGGDEFAVVLPRADARQAEAIARRIAQRLSELRCAGEPHCGSCALTASFGIASAPADATDAEGLIHRADEALYAAKSSGRNTTVLASDLLSEAQTSSNASVRRILRLAR